MLDEATAARIAAGEVIERPASAVKELVENSLDAGARRVDIEIECGGKALIRVTDDGCGMDPDDAVLAFSRHATSKIRRVEDIFRVGTLGFRGEALASIAAVATVELRTAVAGAVHGTAVRATAGKRPEVAGTVPVPGTSVIVRDIFARLPARLKFLKSDAAESARISDVVCSIALGNPGVSFTLRVDGREVLRTQGTGSLGDAIASLFDAGLLRDLIPVDLAAGEGAARVWGFVGKPRASRGSRAIQYIFINRRHVRNLAIRAAVEGAYAGEIRGGTYPVFFLNLSLPAGDVDVNVHPQKLEVKLLREKDTCRLVYAATCRALAGSSAERPGAGYSRERPAP
ncbi:MAG: DNA mismatch repair endonuclease MutL, partial [Firmicutes bacterium]|nr:DNA mismatch repair endonuclease MutL [Bacillota bacterium]